MEIMTQRNGEIRCIPEYLFVGMGLLCCYFFSEIRLSGLVAMGILIFYLLTLFRRDMQIFYKYLYFIFGATIATTGCAVIEYCDIYLPELSAQSEFTGALPTQVLSYWLLLEIIRLSDNHFSKQIKRYAYDNKKQNRAFIETKELSAYTLSIFAMIVFCYIFMKVLPNPSFEIGVDRFTYSKLFNYGRAYSIIIKLSNYLILPCLMLAICRRSKVGTFAIALYCLHSLWVGNKFGVFFSLLCYFAMIYDKEIAEERKKRKMAWVLAAGIITLVLIAAIITTFIIPAKSNDYLGARLAQQGQLWWRTYGSSTQLHMGELGDEIRGLSGSTEIRNNVGARFGIYKVMYNSAPRGQVDSKIASGSIYTEAGFAAAYYYFNIAGCVALALFGGLIASVSVNLILYYLHYSQFARAFLCTHIFLALKSLMSSFVFFGLINSLAIISYIILIISRKKIFQYGSVRI